jgi:hypothetical protein
MWAVITLFVIITISTGLLLGLLFVLLIDCLCATRKTHQELDSSQPDEDDILDDKNKDSADDSKQASPSASKEKKKRAKKDN